MQSSREIRIATAIFPTLSLLNHSCCPNTSLVFSTGTGVDPSASALPVESSEGVAEGRSTACGVTATVRAAKEIAAGREILHCYGRKRIMSVCLKQNHFDLGTATECRQMLIQTQNSGLICNKVD